MRHCIKTETVQNVLKTMSINVEFGSYFTDSYNNYKIGPLEWKLKFILLIQFAFSGRNIFKLKQLVVFLNQLKSLYIKVQ